MFMEPKPRFMYSSKKVSANTIFSFSLSKLKVLISVKICGYIMDDIKFFAKMTFSSHTGSLNFGSNLVQIESWTFRWVFLPVEKVRFKARFEILTLILVEKVLFSKGLGAVFQ